MKAKMPESQPSLLLTKEENDLVFKMLGPRCLSLATAVVQLFTTEGPGHDVWVKRDTGILCLVKDNPKRSYFFRIYCMQRCKMIWEHEVYNQIVYKAPRPFLHTFEAEEYMTAFNFASEDEADILKTHLYEKIELKKQRREERQRQKMMQMSQNRLSSNDTSSWSSHGSNATKGSAQSQSSHHHHHHHGVNNNNNSGSKVVSPTPVVTAPQMNQQTTMNGTAMKPVNNSVFPVRQSQGVKRNKTRKLTKADIGLPQDFKHVSHVGWDANKGFDIEKLSEESEKHMRDFFLRAGVSDTQLKDKDTMEFIYDFISKNGGLDAVKEDLSQSGKPGPGVSLSKSVTGLNQSLRSQAPPPVPARTPLPAPSVSSRERDRDRETRAAPPPPARAPPPPPPPLRTLPPPPQVPTTPAGSATSAVAPPPPPPPPPPPMAPQPPPPPPAAGGGMAQPPPQMDARAALMESIKGGGGRLRHVETNNSESKPVASSDDTRSDLLAKIRQGVELKSVATNNEERKAPPMENKMGLAGALARALEERNKAMHSDSDNSDQGDSSSDGDEWED